MRTKIIESFYDSQPSPPHFDERITVKFDHAISLGLDYVNLFDKPNSWQLRTVENEVKKYDKTKAFGPVYSEIKKRDLKPYATILKINDSCDLEETAGDASRCTHNDAVNLLQSTRKLTLAYYNTRDPYKITGDTPFHVDPNMPSWVKPVCITSGFLVGLIVLFVICYFGCRRKKKQNRSAHANSQQMSHGYGPQSFTGQQPIADEVYMHCENITANQKTYLPALVDANQIQNDAYHIV